MANNEMSKKRKLDNSNVPTKPLNPPKTPRAQPTLPKQKEFLSEPPAIHFKRTITVATRSDQSQAMPTVSTLEKAGVNEAEGGKLSAQSLPTPKAGSVQSADACPVIPALSLCSIC